MSPSECESTGEKASVLLGPRPPAPLSRLSFSSIPSLRQSGKQLFSVPQLYTVQFMCSARGTWRCVCFFARAKVRRARGPRVPRTSSRFPPSFSSPHPPPRRMLHRVCIHACLNRRRFSIGFSSPSPRGTAEVLRRCCWRRKTCLYVYGENGTKNRGTLSPVFTRSRQFPPRPPLTAHPFSIYIPARILPRSLSFSLLGSLCRFSFLSALVRSFLRSFVRVFFHWLVPGGH